MKQFISNLLSDKGLVSAMRFMSIVSLLTACTLAFMGVNKPIPDYSGISILCSTFLGAAFGGKWAQKRVEMNGAKTETELDTHSQAIKDADK